MKKILLLIFPFLLCACSLDYTVNINTKEELEEIAIFEEPNILEKEDGVFFNNRNNHAFLMSKYKNFTTNSKYINEGTDYQIIAQRKTKGINNLLNEYKDLIEDYSYSGLITKKLSFNIKSDVFNKYKLDTLKLNIKTPYKVTNSNSDQNIGNYYTWNITKDKRKVTMEINYKENMVELENSSEKNTKITLWVLLGIILFSFILIPFIILIKKER